MKDPPTEGLREGVIVLDDGRCLAFAEWGPASAPAIVYCHGYPGGRREIGLIRSVLEDNQVNVRVIGLSRPGYGPSDPVPGYGFLDWPSDVAQVADRLGLDQFAVVGASGGAPFALACGLEIPERITRIGVVVGAAPLEATGMSEAHGITSIAGSYWVRRSQYAAVALAVRMTLGNRMTAWINRDLSEADQAVLRRPESQHRFQELVSEVFSDWGRRAAEEASLYLEPWGFDVADITTETHLFYATRDHRIPVSAGRWLDEQLPNSKLTVWSDHGHFSWAASTDAIAMVNALI